MVKLEIRINMHMCTHSKNVWCTCAWCTCAWCTCAWCTSAWCTCAWCTSAWCTSAVPLPYPRCWLPWSTPIDMHVCMLVWHTHHQVPYLRLIPDACGLEQGPCNFGLTLTLTITIIALLRHHSRIHTWKETSASPATRALMCCSPLLDVCVGTSSTYPLAYMCDKNPCHTCTYPRVCNSTLLVAYAYTCTGLSCIGHRANKHIHPRLSLCGQMHIKMLCVNINSHAYGEGTWNAQGQRLRRAGEELRLA